MRTLLVIGCVAIMSGAAWGQYYDDPYAVQPLIPSYGQAIAPLSPINPMPYGYAIPNVTEPQRQLDDHYRFQQQQTDLAILRELERANAYRDQQQQRQRNSRIRF